MYVKCRTFLWHILFLYALMCVLVSYHFRFVHLVYLMGHHSPSTFVYVCQKLLNLLQKISKKQVDSTYVGPADRLKRDKLPSTQGVQNECTVKESAAEDKY